MEELANIEGFDEEVAEELRARGRYYLERQQEENESRRRELGVGDDLTQIAGLSSAMLVALGENEIKTRDDLADLASDELAEILGDEAPDQEALDRIIMAARAHWFADQEDAAEAEGEAEPGGEEGADAKGAAPAEASPPVAEEQA